MIGQYLTALAVTAALLVPAIAAAGPLRANAVRQASAIAKPVRIGYRTEIGIAVKTQSPLDRSTVVTHLPDGVRYIPADRA